MHSPISVTILTKNSQKHLPGILDRLSAFDEILILDSGSEDATLSLVTNYANVSLYQDRFTGFGEMHNKATALARNDWILSIDSDEVPSEELLTELATLQLDAGCVYTIPRRNIYNGKVIKHCGWWPDRVKRLYNRTATQWSDAEVHESVLTAGMRIIDLQHPLIHYSYEGIGHFLSKMQSYSDLFVKQNKDKKAASPCKAVLHGLAAFIKTYFIKRGFLDGWEGLIISSYNANTAFYKYLKLYEANCSQRNAAYMDSTPSKVPFHR
ncbi:MAG: glycosyltransferase family 2 protein [Chlamydiia bacterium]|nr:glycosyltransferase family 2 protein [Chlamydiia bacterium]